MDLYCKRCGEPYDFFHVQDEMQATEGRRFYDGDGCPACYEKEIKRRPFRAQAMEVLHEILGDDLDGLAAELEDAEFLLGSGFWEE